MSPSPESPLIAPAAKSRSPVRPRRRKTAMRWFLGVCAFALMAGTTRLVGNAFADLGRERAQVRALDTIIRQANAAAGANLGPRWQTLIETPAGGRALVGWFEPLEQAWPAACATEMMTIGQTAAACLPVPDTLAPLVDQRLGDGAYQALSALRANPPDVGSANPVALADEEDRPPADEAAAPRRVETVLRTAAPAAEEVATTPFDDGSAFVPQPVSPVAESAHITEQAQPESGDEKFEPASVAANQAAQQIEAATEAMVSPPGFEPGTY